MKKYSLYKDFDSDCYCEMQEDENGEYVLHEDYLKEKSGNLPEAVSRNVVLADVLSEIREFAWTDNNTGERYVYIEQLKNYLGKYFS